MSFRCFRMGVGLMLSAPLVILVGCGATTSSDQTAPTALVLAAGQWEFNATSSVSNAVVPIGSFLAVNGNAVSGPVSAQVTVPTVCGPCCGVPFGSFLSANVSGTYGAAGNVTLKTPAGSDGSVLTIEATTSDGKTFSGGSYTIAGGCFSDHGSMNGTHLASLDGAYAGVVKSINTGTSYTISATLDQSATLDSRQLLEVTGSVAFTGYPCFTSATLDTSVMSNGFLGNLFSAGLDTPDLANAASVSGTLSTDAKVIDVTYVAGGPGTGCPLDVGQGTLNLQ